MMIEALKVQNNNGINLLCLFDYIRHFTQLLKQNIQQNKENT